MSEFTREEDKYYLDLTVDEAHILINLVEQLLELLGVVDIPHHYDESDPFAQLMHQLKPAPEEVATPEDPVLLRLLPNAYADPESAADFRRFTEPAMRSKKNITLRKAREALAVIVDSNSPGVVEDLDSDTWLAVINDLRIALSVRLEVDESSFEKFEALPESDPQKPLYAVYFWLGWLQSNLLDVMLSHHS
jgi:hypothetical protein